MDFVHSDVRLTILQLIKWTPVDKRAVVNEVTRDLVLQFATRFKEVLFIEGLVQGNFTAKVCSNQSPDPQCVSH